MPRVLAIFTGISEINETDVENGILDSRMVSN